MDQLITTMEIKQAQAEAKIAGSQSPTPVGSQSENEYALVSPGTPIGRPPIPKPEEIYAPIAEVRRFANPAPLGLCAFALTSFMSNIMNVHLGLTTAAENVGSALIYGGTVQLLAGMWYVVRYCIHDIQFKVVGNTNVDCDREMALGNTFSATSFCSYGAYWITFGVISDLQGTKIVAVPETVCQKEILMGLFLLVGRIHPCNPYPPVASVNNSAPIPRPGSYSPR